MGQEELILETGRLVLRKLTQDDYADLCDILQDEQAMAAYEHAFSNAEAQEWLDRQLDRYKNDGFGLWAVIVKETGQFVGQAGLTLQDCGEKRVPEIGYLFKRQCWHMGYATEAARAIKEYAFYTLGYNEVYSIIRDTNLASQNVAKRNQMIVKGSFVKHYYGMDMMHIVFCAVRKDERGVPVCGAVNI